MSMIRLPKLVYVAFVAAVLSAVIGVIAASTWWPTAAHPAPRYSNQIAEPDYVQELAKRGIATLPYSQ
jgi:hypothetical protein